MHKRTPAIPIMCPVRNFNIRAGPVITHRRVSSVAVSSGCISDFQVSYEHKILPNEFQSLLLQVKKNKTISSLVLQSWPVRFQNTWC